MSWSSTVINAWTTGGFAPKIVTETGKDYMSLLAHLIALKAKLGWPETLKEGQNYAKDLTNRRPLQPSRIAALCRTYIFLCDGHNSRWRNPKLDNVRFLEMRCHLDELRSQQTISNQAKDYCPKCRTRVLHLPGKDNCPFKENTNDQAKKLGQNLWRRLAQNPVDEEILPEE